MNDKKIKIDKIKVEAKKSIMLRRPITIQGLSVKQVRELKKGYQIEINKSVYDKNQAILKEVN